MPTEPTGVQAEIAAALDAVALVDHHVHSPSRELPDAATLAFQLSESNWAAAAGTDPFGTQLFFAVRRHCAPLLGLPHHVAADEYFQERSALGVEDLNRLLLRAAGVSHWLVDTGHGADQLVGLPELADLSGGKVEEIVRLEAVLEDVVTSCEPSDLEAVYATALAERTRGAVGLKTIVAYRYGLDLAPERPSSAEVLAAAEAWRKQIDGGAAPRVDDPVLLRMVIWAGVDTGLPIQFHVGYGDPDLDLHRVNPLLLTPWLREIRETGTDVLLLHCYPFQREAGYLAHVFPHVYFDVGLGVNYTGAASDVVVAESLELAPFGKVLYSSDAWGPPELHHLGAVLWRRGMTKALSRWVTEGEWSLEDAVGVARQVGRENALRVYRIPG